LAGVSRSTLSRFTQESDFQQAPIEVRRELSGDIMLKLLAISGEAVQALHRVPAAFLESERRTLPAAWYAQEYLCEFGENEASVFRVADVEAAFTPLVSSRVVQVCLRSRKRVSGSRASGHAVALGGTNLLAFRPVPTR
jgi:hypothetical protein